MSNRLLNLAKAITTINGRKIHPSEKLVLLALADDARDHLGGRTKDLIINRQLQEATGLSERAVRMAISVLIAAGHISRQPGKPGAAMDTLVHPRQAAEQAPEQAIAGPADVAAKPADIAAQPATIAGGSYSIRIKDQDNPSPTLGRAREPAAADQDEVGQVFAAWDAFHQRAGLQPVARGMARRGAVAARIADHGLGNALMVVDRTERAVKQRRQPKGQGDLFFSFDMVFGVGKAAGIGLFERMLDGEFTPAEPVVVAPAVEARAGEGPAEAAARAKARVAIGEAAYGAWLAGAAFRIDGDAVAVQVGSAFAADFINQNISGQLRRAGLAVRVGVERVCV